MGAHVAIHTKGQKVKSNLINFVNILFHNLWFSKQVTVFQIQIRKRRPSLFWQNVHLNTY